tara:strand:- start:5914 stop:6558 length:645 start_codon:yes stop_codon:yes gene_type:complete
VGFFLLFLLSLKAQGDINLYKQYGTGPDPDNFFRPWNFSLYAKINSINSNQDYTKGKLSKGAGISIQRLLSKTFGASLGVEFYEIKYTYEGYLNDSMDEIDWIGIPLSIRLYPSRKLFFEIGAKYNILVTAKNSEIIDPITGNNQYYDGIFDNTIGGFAGVQYQIWKRLNIGLSYQSLKRNKNNIEILQPSIFSGLSFKFSVFLLDPYKRPEIK